MSTNIYVDSLKNLEPFLNEKGVLEVALRDKNKKFEQFVNIAFNNTRTEQSELVEKAVGCIADMARDNQLGLDSIIQNAQLLSDIGSATTMLGALNLCATIAGFALIYGEIKQMSAEINRQLMQLDETVRKSFDIEHKFRFDEVLADHNDMLDAIKRQQPYAEQDMRRLVDSEYRMIELLVNTLEADVSNDQASLITLIFMLVGMFTASLCNFDELYYFNNPQTHGHANPWHTSHDNWMSVYNTLCSDWLVERLQDYSVLELGLRTWEADLLYLSLLAKVVDAKEKVEDNQALIVAFGSKSALHRFQKLVRQDVADTIRNVYEEAGAGMDEDEVEESCEEALRRAALA